MKTELRSVLAFARKQQRGQWVASDFHKALGAYLTIGPIRGGRIAGFSIRNRETGTSTVAIDEGIEQTNYYLPVYGHEISHLLLGTHGAWACAVYGTGANRIHDTWHSQIERLAWYGSTLLTIPTAHMRAFHRGKMGASDIASACMVPIQFVNLRLAIQNALDDELPIHEEQAQIAYRRWQEYITQQLRQRLMR